jgi:hypothetical protein
MALDKEDSIQFACMPCGLEGSTVRVVVATGYCNVDVCELKTDAISSVLKDGHVGITELCWKHAKLLLDHSEGTKHIPHTCKREGMPSDGRQ